MRFCCSNRVVFPPCKCVSRTTDQTALVLPRIGIHIALQLAEPLFPLPSPAKRPRTSCTLSNDDFSSGRAERIPTTYTGRRLYCGGGLGGSRLAASWRCICCRTGSFDTISVHCNRTQQTLEKKEASISRSHRYMRGNMLSEG